VRRCAAWSCRVLDVGGDLVFGGEDWVWYLQGVPCLPRPRQLLWVERTDDRADRIVATGPFERFQSIFGHDPDVVHGRSSLRISDGAQFNYRLELGPVIEEYRFPWHIGFLVVDGFLEATPEIRNAGIVPNDPENVSESTPTRKVPDLFGLTQHTSTQPGIPSPCPSPTATRYPSSTSHPSTLACPLPLGDVWSRVRGLQVSESYQ
jgi:hypothetical protein